MLTSCMATATNSTQAGMADTPNLVAEYLDAHPEWVSDEFETKACELAQRAELTHPINRAPSTVAAAAIYMAGLLVNEKLTQKEVAAASGVSTAAIREGYIELCKHEGFSHARHETDDEAPTGLVGRVKNWVSRRD